MAFAANTRTLRFTLGSPLLSTLLARFQSSILNFHPIFRHLWSQLLLFMHLKMTLFFRTPRLPTLLSFLLPSVSPPNTPSARLTPQPRSILTTVHPTTSRLPSLTYMTLALATPGLWVVLPMAYSSLIKVASETSMDCPSLVQQVSHTGVLDAIKPSSALATSNTLASHILVNLTNSS